jgi:nucleotide-binding universal stress UspA family protein
MTEPLNAPIVAGFDPRTLDRAPVHFAVAAARLTDSPLIVAAAGATAPIIDSLPPAYVDEEMADLGVQAFAELRDELNTSGVPIEYREVHGTSAARCLYELADRESARLLVVGSTHRGTIGQVLPGSTAERLMHAAPCAIAVVPRGWEAEGLHTIGVAYAQTDEGVEALRGAFSLAERAGASLRVLSVVRERAAMYGELTAGTRFERSRSLIDVEGEHRIALEATMRDAVAELPGLASDVKVEIEAFVGDPAETLIGISEHLDLLVCGSRGYGPLHATLLGGVSRRVIAAAQCPVLVLARGVGLPLEPRAAGSGAATA